MFHMNVDIRYNMVLVGLQYYTFLGNENFSILLLQIHNANYKGPKNVFDRNETNTSGALTENV